MGQNSCMTSESTSDKIFISSTAVSIILPTIKFQDIYIYIYMCVCVCVCVCVSVCVLCTHVCVCLCLWMCLYLCACVFHCPYLCSSVCERDFWKVVVPSNNWITTQFWREGKKIFLKWYAKCIKEFTVPFISFYVWMKKFSHIFVWVYIYIYVRISSKLWLCKYYSKDALYGR